jgi:hypothetical protein
MPTRSFVELVNGSVFLNLEQGNVVRLIIGGNDGILVTIDAAGHVHVTPPDGPGDPEVRQAVASIVQGVATITRLGAAQGGAARAGA